MGGPVCPLVADALVRWVRIPVGVLLIVVGVFGFLPVLGFWMVPLGAVLLATDIPLLRHPTLKAFGWVERKWAEWKTRRKS